MTLEESEKPKLRRVQARKEGVTGYINAMRGTWLGNPFPLSRYSLDESLRLYREYLDWRYANDTIFADYLIELAFRSTLEEILIGCTCKEKSKCHVDVLKDFIASIYNV